MFADIICFLKTKRGRISLQSWKNWIRDISLCPPWLQMKLPMTMARFEIRFLTTDWTNNLIPWLSFYPQYATPMTNLSQRTRLWRLVKSPWQKNDLNSYLAITSMMSYFLSNSQSEEQTWCWKKQNPLTETWETYMADTYNNPMLLLDARMMIFPP